MLSLFYDPSSDLKIHPVITATILSAQFVKQGDQLLVGLVDGQINALKGVS